MEDVPRYWSLDLHPGKYVAVDMKTDQVVLTADSPHQLVDDIKAAGLRNIMVIRAPMEEDPLAVGPG